MREAFSEQAGQASQANNDRHADPMGTRRGHGKAGLGRVRSYIATQVREHPLRCAGLTAAAGFVIGGGLATRTTLRALRRTLSLAVKTAVVPALLMRLRDTLMGDVER